MSLNMAWNLTGKDILTRAPHDVAQALLGQSRPSPRPRSPTRPR